MLAKWQCVLHTHTWRARSNRIESHRIISVKICSICVCSKCVFRLLLFIMWFCNIKCVVFVWNSEYTYVYVPLASMSIDGRHLILCHFSALLHSVCIFIDSMFCCYRDEIFFIHHSFVRLFVHHILTESRNSRHCVAFTFFAEIHMFH